MTTATYALPLEPEELTLLQRALGSRSLHGALGFLTAIVSVPEPIATEAWLGELLGESSGRDQQPERLSSIVLRLTEHVAGRMFEDDPEAIVPAAGQIEAVREWCEGYIDVIDQLEIPDDEAVLSDLFTLDFLAGRVGDEELSEVLEERISAVEFSAAARDDLPDVVASLHAAWSPARRRRAAVRRESPKIGRNDPCSCGSGKKYKKCCGAALN